MSYQYYRNSILSSLFFKELEFCHKKEEKEVGRFMSFLISNNQEEGMGRIGGFLEFKK
jgi:hypothetical protein